MVATSCPSIHLSSQNKAQRPSPSRVYGEALKKAWTSLDVWIGNGLHARSWSVFCSQSHRVWSAYPVSFRLK
jgi:hypothetical protein